MSTPPYAPPSVGPAGLTISSYASILADNLQAFLNIYGQNQYVQPDSAIYQLLAILSLKQSDTNLGLQLAYNQTSPQTAVGAGLDRAVKMNGLAREAFTYSTVSLTCTGTVGLVLTNAFAQDQAGNLWALPSPLTLVGGTATAVATCTTPGNVAAEPSTINIKASPVNGWATVNNTYAATPGSPVEPDSKLRARQAVSVALPALTPIAATVAAILATLNVTRVAPGYPTPGGPGTSIENPTGAADSWGNPAHSITMVVEGGTDAAVGLSIYLKKTIGCFTNGTTSTVVVDPNTGYAETISFYRPSYIQPFIGMYLQGLPGFTTATVIAVQAALVAYLNSLAIGEEVTYSALWSVALSVTPNISQPEFSIKGVSLGSTATGLFTVVPGASAGTGYVVNDVLTVPVGTGGTVTVTSVSGGGAITGVAAKVTTPGTGYALATAQAVTGGTGTGGHVNITAVQPTAATDLSVLFYQASQGVSAHVVVAAV